MICSLKHIDNSLVEESSLNISKPRKFFVIINQSNDWIDEVADV